MGPAVCLRVGVRTARLGAYTMSYSMAQDVRGPGLYPGARRKGLGGSCRLLCCLALESQLVLLGDPGFRCASPALATPSRPWLLVPRTADARARAPRAEAWVRSSHGAS